MARRNRVDPWGDLHAVEGRGLFTGNRDAYRSYRDAVSAAVGSPRQLTAIELNGRLASERLRRGRGIDRRADRRLWTADLDTLPIGTVIVGDDLDPHLVLGDLTRRFSFDGWVEPIERRGRTNVTVLTPQTSVVALRHGCTPVLHPSANRSWSRWEDNRCRADLTCGAIVN